MKPTTSSQGDEERLRERMPCWLQAVANSLFEEPMESSDRGIALCMLMNPHFERDEIAVGPLGPRDREWLSETRQEGTREKDFFARWTPGFNESRPPQLSQKHERRPVGGTPFV